MENQSYLTIDKSKECLGVLGDVTHRAMFGGYALAVDRVVFAMIVGQHLYLRACGDNAAWFASQQQPKLSFYKRGRKITLDYDLVGEALWHQPQTLIVLAYRALMCARQLKSMRDSDIRLKDLPNLTVKLEVQLLQAGIGDIATLKRYGARACWLRLRARNHALGVQSLFALQGAITGIHADALPAQTRRELVRWMKGLPVKRDD